MGKLQIDMDLKYLDNIDLLNCGDRNIYNISFFNGDYAWDIINEN